MEARSILCWDYDWVGVALSTNEDTGKEAVFSCGELVLAQNRDGTGSAVAIKFLSESDTA